MRLRRRKISYDLQMSACEVLSRSCVEWNIYDTCNDTTDVSFSMGTILWNEDCGEDDGERIREL